MGRGKGEGEGKIGWPSFLSIFRQPIFPSPFPFALPFAHPYFYFIFLGIWAKGTRGPQIEKEIEIWEKKDKKRGIKGPHISHYILGGLCVMPKYNVRKYRGPLFPSSLTISHGHQP